MKIVTDDSKYVAESVTRIVGLVIAIKEIDDRHHDLNNPVAATLFTVIG